MSDQAPIVQFPPMHPKQKEVFEDKHRYIVVAGGRRLGKTSLGVVKCMKTALEGGRTWWVAPSLGNANEGWMTLTKFSSAIPGSQVMLGERSVKYQGGGMVQVRTASEPSRLRGPGLDGVVLDEAAFMKGEAWYQVLSPALSDRQGWALFISTPFGFDNWFADLYARAKDDPEWSTYQIPSSANPKMSEDELEKQKQWLPADVYAQEFLGEFVVPGGQVFKSEWFHYYEETDAFYVLGHRFVNKQDVWKFSTVDLSVSTRETADYTVIATWAVSKESDLILLDVVRKRMEGPDIVPALQAAYNQHRPGYMAIERAGFQLSIVQDATRAGLPVKELKADRDKLTRALPAAARMESGKIWFPRASNWLSDLERELLAFPKAPHDDQVDVVSYGAIEASGLTMSTFDIGKLVESRDPFGLEAPAGAGWNRHTDRKRLVESEGFIEWRSEED